MESVSKKPKFAAANRRNKKAKKGFMIKKEKTKLPEIERVDFSLNTDINIEEEMTLSSHSGVAVMLLEVVKIPY